MEASSQPLVFYDVGRSAVGGMNRHGTNDNHATGRYLAFACEHPGRCDRDRPSPVRMEEGCERVAPLQTVLIRVPVWELRGRIGRIKVCL